MCGIRRVIWIIFKSTSVPNRIYCYMLRGELTLIISQLCTHYFIYIILFRASQFALVVRNPPANAGDLRDSGLIPAWGTSPGGGSGNPLQYSCLENLMDRGAWQTTAHGVTKSWIQLLRGKKSKQKKAGIPSMS